MDDNLRNQLANRYVKEHLSPTPDERDYIKGKYTQLREFLNYSCFRSGSYARYTAIHPVHDLDVIFIVNDPAIQDDPAGFMQRLKTLIEGSTITGIRRVYAQTHSVTIEFDDCDGEFSIDIVPAIETNDVNEFDQPTYIVPEILEMNQFNRQRRYAHSDERPIDWVKSDPRGYITASKQLNDANSDYRHAVKLLKAWRHSAKLAYKDDLRLKSFHLELLAYRYFSENPQADTVNAVINCLTELPDCINRAQFADRADPERYIDDYVDELTAEEKHLIIRLQGDAYRHAVMVSRSDSEEDITEQLDELTTVQRRNPAPTPPPPAPREVTPRQPWAS